VCVPSNRERASHCPELAIESELTDEYQTLNGVGGELPGCDEDADRDWQIERSAVLPYIGRREIDGDPTRRNFEAGVDQRRTDTLATLLHRARGEAHDRPLGQSLRGVDLDDDVVRIDADKGGRSDSGEHLPS
jgi:hypothetical protein